MPFYFDQLLLTPSFASIALCKSASRVERNCVRLILGAVLIAICKSNVSTEWPVVNPLRVELRADIL